MMCFGYIIIGIRNWRMSRLCFRRLSISSLLILLNSTSRSTMFTYASICHVNNSTGMMSISLTTV